MDLAGWLKLCPIVAILRGVKPDEVESIGHALVEEGISVIEVPLNSPNAFESIAILSRVFGDRILVGAGTVAHSRDVVKVADAGGRLIVMPHADLEIVHTAKRAGLLAAPGFFNPTEAFALLEAGADAIKMFPAEVLGIPMLKAMRAVLPASACVLPVGGVDAGNIPQWMAAGAAGVGVGSSIYKPGENAEAVRQKAKSLLAAAALFPTFEVAAF